MTEEKKPYHEPDLRTYGSLTDVTQDAVDDPLGFEGSLLLLPPSP